MKMYKDLRKRIKKKKQTKKLPFINYIRTVFIFKWHSSLAHSLTCMVLLTFFASLLTGLLPFHHVITASGLEPDVLHSTS